MVWWFDRTRRLGLAGNEYFTEKIVKEYAHKACIRTIPYAWGKAMQHEEAILVTFALRPVWGLLMNLKSNP
jgi:hypothetical protein